MIANPSGDGMQATLLASAQRFARSDSRSTRFGCWWGSPSRGRFSWAVTILELIQCRPHVIAAVDEGDELLNGLLAKNVVPLGGAVGFARRP